MQEKLIICGRCSKSVPLAEIKYVARGSETLPPIPMCASCRENRPGQRRNEKDPDEVTRKQFVCEACHFKFQFNTSSSARVRCPFCGSTRDVEEYKTGFAEELLKSL